MQCETDNADGVTAVENSMKLAIDQILTLKDIVKSLDCLQVLTSHLKLEGADWSVSFCLRLRNYVSSFCPGLERYICISPITVSELCSTFPGPRD